MLRYVTLCSSSRAGSAPGQAPSAAMAGAVIDKSGSILAGTAVQLVSENAAAVRFGKADNPSERRPKAGCGFGKGICAR
jgi:hypothetical protein